MKKVLLLAPLTTLEWGTKNMGGVDSVCQMLIKNLQHNPSTDFFYRVIAFDPTNSVSNEGEIIKINSSLEIIQFNIKNPTKSKLAKLPNLLHQIKIIKAQVKNFSPDIVHSHFASWLVGLNKALPTISTIHSYKKIGRKPRGFLNNLLYERVLPSLTPFYIDRYTCVSKYLKSHIKNDIKKDVSVIYNPIDEAYFNHNKVNNPSSDIAFVTCALIHYKKGIHHIVDVLYLLKQQGYKATLKVIGPESDKDYVNTLKNSIASKGLVKEVEFLGAKKTEEIVNIYKKCDIGMFLSSEETFGLVPIEMLAANLPVQCLNTGVISDLNDSKEKAGLCIYNTVNSSKIAKDAVFLKSNKVKVNNDFIHELFSVGKVINDYENLYKKTISK